MNRVVVLGVIASSMACASSQVSQSVARSYSGPPIRAIALSPGAGVLGEAIGVELFNRGYTVVDPDETMRVIGRGDLSEFEVSNAGSLAALAARGIDALLVCKSAAGSDGRPQSATARITSTRDGTIIAAVSWQNGWGGQAGSPADRMMRKDLNDAASEIVAALAARFAGTTR